VSEPMYPGYSGMLKVVQTWISSQRSHLSLVTLAEARWWNGRSRNGSKRETVEAGVVEVVGIAEVVDGSGATGAGEVGGGVDTVAEGVEGAVE
jgi:hypothetical protein